MSQENYFEVKSDGKTVWVNGPDGGCWARFGQGGVDIHKPVADQIASGTQCLNCTHTVPTIEDWRKFKRELKERFEVQVTDKHMPSFVKRVG